MREKLRRYEFENRTSGGVVQFESYEHSKSHAHKMRRAIFINNFGAFFFLVGLVATYFLVF
ncbi:MAG TPA: hypothetical protein ENH60_11500 [Pricia sp.]|nr:hypothetical protein [Pricia sp.]